MPEDTLPGRVGRFEIRRELGRGTMGVVFEAHDATLHRTIALKVIRLAFAATSKEREDFERRFLTEARAAAGLSHPGIVVVHEAGRDEATGMLYLALEHLVGQSLSDRLAQKGRFEEKEALRIAAQVARALDYAHRRGVVHRDIKPANVMLLPDGQVKILDFGLAKIEAGHEQTAAGQFLGTPLFVSPEQALGQKVDGRSDIFSLGAILYTLLAGRRPFEGETLARILTRVAHQPPKPLREEGGAVSAAAESVTMRALAKDPDDRYPTGAAMAEDLEDVLAGRPLQPRASPAPGAAREAGATGGAGERSAGEGTVVAGAGNLESLTELGLDEAEAARRRRPVPLRAISLGLLMGGLAIHYWSIAGPERLAEAMAPLFAWPRPPRPVGKKPAPEWAAASLPQPSSEGSDLLEPDAPPIEASLPAGSVALDPSSAPSPAQTSEQKAVVAAPTSEAGAVVAPPVLEPTPFPAVAPLGDDPRPAPNLRAEAAEDEAPILLPDEDEPAAELSTPGSSPAAVPPVRVLPGPVAQSLPGPTAIPTPSPAPTPSGSTPSAPAPPSVSPRAATPEKAALAIRIEHPLTRGTVRVWLDDKLVLRTALSSVVSKKILFFSFRNGRVRETLQVAPGKRRLKVEVRGKDRNDSQQVVAEFRPGARRRLDVREGASPGRLSFAWR